MKFYRLRFLALPAIFLACSIVLPGCMDNYEMKHQSFIAAIGLDRTEDNHIKVSLLELLFDTNQQEDSGQSGQGDQSNNAKVISATCTFFPECMNRLQNQLSGRLNLNQTQYILFGKKILESGVKSYIDYFYHIAQMEQTVKVFATDQNMDEFLQNDKGKLLNRLIGGIEFHPFVFNVEMWEFAPKIYTQLRSAVVSSLVIRGNSLNSNEIYLLKESKLGMKLPVDDALLVHLLIEDKANDITLTFQEQNIAYQIRKYSVNMQVTPQSVDLYVRINGWILNNHNEKVQGSLNDLEGTISKEISNRMRLIMDKAQSKGVDFLGIGERFRQKNWDSSKWKERLKELNINIHVDAKVLSGKGSQ